MLVLNKKDPAAGSHVRFKKMLQAFSTNGTGVHTVKNRLKSTDPQTTQGFKGKFQDPELPYNRQCCCCRDSRLQSPFSIVHSRAKLGHLSTLDNKDIIV